MCSNFPFETNELVIGICLLNDMSANTCYNEKQIKVLRLIGGCMLRKHKFEYDKEKLEKMGDASHLFEDPIDIQKRNEENQPRDLDEAEVEPVL